MHLKICSKCKKKKDISKFCKNKNEKDGLNCHCKKCTAKYYQKNKKQIEKKHKEWIAERPHRYWAMNSLTRHRQKGYIVKITIDELEKLAKQTQRCSICGFLLKWGYGSKQGKPASSSPTLDRMNNDKILTIKNIQILCYHCNAAKRTKTMEEFIEYCKMVANKY